MSRSFRSSKTLLLPFLVKISFLFRLVLLSKQGKIAQLNFFRFYLLFFLFALPPSLSFSSCSCFSIRFHSINKFMLPVHFQDVIEGRGKSLWKTGFLDASRTLKFTADFSLLLLKLLKYYVWFISHKVNNMRELIHNFPNIYYPWHLWRFS